MESRISIKHISIVLIFTLMITSVCVPLLSNDSTYAAAKKTKISTKKAKINKGQTLKLSVTKASKDKSKKVTWKSSKKKVASVSKSGLVTAKKAGKATITAKVGKKKLKCKITVTDVGSGTLSDPYKMNKGVNLSLSGGNSGTAKVTRTFVNDAAVNFAKANEEWNDSKQNTYNVNIAEYDLVAYELNISVNSGYIGTYHIWRTPIYTPNAAKRIGTSGSPISGGDYYNSSFDYGQSGKVVVSRYIKKGNRTFIMPLNGVNDQNVWVQYQY